MLRGVIRAWRYVIGCEGREEVEPSQIDTKLDPTGAVLWIDALSPTDDELHELRDDLGLSPSVVDAILNPRERTKLMRYGDYFHVAVHDCECSRSDGRQPRDRHRHRPGMAGHGSAP